MSTTTPAQSAALGRLSLADMRQVAEMWRNMLLMIFPVNKYAQHPLRDTQYSINLDLTTYASLGVGSVVRTQGFNAGVHFLQANFTAAPAEGAPFPWAENELYLGQELSRSMESVPYERRRPIYGLIAIGTYVRLYGFMPDGRLIAAIYRADGKQTLRINSDMGTIQRWLRGIKEDWI